MEAFACKNKKKATKNEYKVAHLGRRNSFSKIITMLNFA